MQRSRLADVRSYAGSLRSGLPFLVARDALPAMYDLVRRLTQRAAASTSCTPTSSRWASLPWLRLQRQARLRCAQRRVDDRRASAADGAAAPAPAAGPGGAAAEGIRGQPLPPDGRRPGRQRGRPAAIWSQPGRRRRRSPSFRLPSTAPRSARWPASASSQQHPDRQHALLPAQRRRRALVHARGVPAGQGGGSGGDAIDRRAAPAARTSSSSPSTIPSRLPSPAMCPICCPTCSRRR